MGSAAEQVIGAWLALIGVATSVAGLLGLKIDPATAPPTLCWRPVTATQRTRGCVVVWAAGQLFQFLAVYFATQSVVAACTNAGIVFNAVGASYYFREPFGRWDTVGVTGLVAGALLVVLTAPVLRVSHLDIDQVAALFQTSAGPACGLIGTAAVAAAAAASLSLLAGWRGAGRRRGAGSGGGVGSAGGGGGVRAGSAGAVLAGGAVGAGWRARSASGIASGLVAGFCGATSISASKLVWLLFAETLRRGGDNGFARLGSWVIGGVMAGGEAAMVAALYLGLRRAEASVVIPCYYGSMTVFAAVQGLLLLPLDLGLLQQSPPSPFTLPLPTPGLLLFDLGPSLSAGGAAGFSCGIALCVASLGERGLRARGGGEALALVSPSPARP